MFDYIQCNYPLPMAIPAWMGRFQTKDLTCYLEEYEITVEGVLVCLSDPTEDWIDFHGDVRFYDSNWSISTKEGVMYTREGTGLNYISIEFVARFTNGKVDRITVASHEQSPAQPASAYYAMTVQESDDDILAKLAHVLKQRERSIESWKVQAHQWKQKADEHRATIARLEAELAAARCGRCLDDASGV